MKDWTKKLLVFTLAFTLMLMAPLSVLAVENDNGTDTDDDGLLVEGLEPGDTTDGNLPNPSEKTLLSPQVGDPMVESASVEEAFTLGDKSPNHKGSCPSSSCTPSCTLPNKIDVMAIKVWVGGEAVREKVWFQLYRNVMFGVPVPYGVPREVNPLYAVYDTNTVVWNSMEKTDIFGNLYFYSVREVDLFGFPLTLPNFIKSECGLKVVNTYKIPTGKIMAEKVWVNGEAIRDTIWLKLYRALDGGELEAVDAPLKEIVPVDGQDNYGEVWKNIELTNSRGEEYTFSVKEVDAEGQPLVLENITVLEEGITVTNTYNIPEGNIPAYKTWSDGPVAKPDIWFRLYRNLDVNDETGWEVVPGKGPQKLADGAEETVFANVELTDSKGNPYSFLVKEVDADGGDYTPVNYVKTEDGLSVTNQYVSPLIDVTAKKVWEGDAETRPTVWFKLYRNVEGEEPEAVSVENIELLDGTVEAVWTDLEETDIKGNKYIYSVKEVDKEGEDFVPAYYVKKEELLEVTNTLIGEGNLVVNKTLEGRKLKNNEFSFTLYNEKGELVKEVKNDAKGLVDFGSMKFEKSGVYKFTILEVKGKNKNIVYDKRTINATVTVDDKGKVEVVYSDKAGKTLDKPTFVNKLGKDKDKDKEKLPSTGMNNPTFLLGLGGVFLLIGFFSLKRKRA